MPSKTSQLTYEQIISIPSTMTNLSSTTDNQSEINDSTTTNSQRRLPLPKKLSIEQNLTNLIEKESPLLQSELLTAEHELSVLRSRLAVNEGVTAVTGTILESLKEQFVSHHKTDSTTSPLHTSQTNLAQQSSSSIQTSPSLENFRDTLEIHFDAESSPRCPFVVIKTLNTFWLAQPIGNVDVEKHLSTFSSPTMKRARIQLPDDFEIEDIDKDSISDEDECIIPNRLDQLTEMQSIRSPSLLQQFDQYEKFDDKIEEIYITIDNIKINRLTPITLTNLQKKIQQLKLIIREMKFSKQDELRIEYEFDELENLFKQTTKYDYSYFIQLFEQNLNELQHIIEQIKSDDQHQSQTETNKSKPKANRLIPEDPVVTTAVFFEGNKLTKQPKTSPAHAVRLIPEDPQINASSFYEGDIHRSFYPHPEVEKKVLIPEKPLVSSEVFYEGDAQRSMFIERSSFSRTNTATSPPVSIDNLREIMSDLMLAASWSKKPPKLDKQLTKDEIEVHAESFLTTEEQHESTPVCEIVHEIENFPVKHPIILIEANDDDENEIVIEDKTQNDEERLCQASDALVNRILKEALVEHENYLFYQAAVEIVNQVLENISSNYNEEFNRKTSLTSSTSSINNQSNAGSSFEHDDDVEIDSDEENENLIPQISDEPYLFVTDVVTSKSTQDLGNLVQELQVLQHQIHDIHVVSSSSSSSPSSLSSSLSSLDETPSSNLGLPQIITTKSVTDLTKLVSELQTIEEQLEEKLDTPTEIIPSPVSSRSFNELGGLMNELKTVTNRIHEQIFTSANINSLSQDLVRYRRDSQPALSQLDENQVAEQLVHLVIRQAQAILLKETEANTKFVPTIIIDERSPTTSHHQSLELSISDDFELSHEDNSNDRMFELADQLDYLRRMSRYENILTHYEPSTNDTQQTKISDEENDADLSINQQSTDSLDFHSFEESEPSSCHDRVKTLMNKPAQIVEHRLTSDSGTTTQHFQSAHDLHDEEKSKLVRSPELYNMDNVIRHHQHSSRSNSQIPYRTVSESALAVDECKHSSAQTSTEFLTTISNDNSCESMQQRLPTPFDDVLEKESSPEQSESINLPPTAFADAYEPTSSSQRPLAFSRNEQNREPTDNEYEMVANDIVNHVLTDVATELISELDDSSMSEKFSRHNDTLSSTSSDNDVILEEDEDEQQDEIVIPKTSARVSFSKGLRRAQTDAKDFDIIQSPVRLYPPVIRRSSQSDTDVYFRGVSPAVDEYLPMDNNSSSDEKSSSKTTHRFHEKYSGEGEDSSGGRERTIQRRKRSNDTSTNYESPSAKINAFKYDTNETFPRQESLESPIKDLNEKFLTKILQESILRSNLQSFQSDLNIFNEKFDHQFERTYSSTSKKCLISNEYDGGSETDREELKTSSTSNRTTDLNIKSLDSEISAQTNATIITSNSNKTSLDDEDNPTMMATTVPSSSSSSSSFQSVIYQQDKSFSSSVNTNSNKHISNSLSSTTTTTTTTEKNTSF